MPPLLLPPLITEIRVWNPGLPTLAPPQPLQFLFHCCDVGWPTYTPPQWQAYYSTQTD